MLVLKKIILVITVLLLVAGLQAQTVYPWKGKKAAVVITYDDAINEHLDNAIPVLDSLGLKATFYVTGFSASVQARLNDWKKISVTGHELGNHTLYHPCAGGPGREWVRAEYDLNNYTIHRLLDEIRSTNVLLQSLDGKTERTFAFTCGDTKIGDTAFAPLLKKDFIAMRGVDPQLQGIEQVDLAAIKCYGVNGQTAEEMIGWVKEAVNKQSLLVILFHGVGGGNGLDVSIPAHREFLHYLKKQQKDIWVAPMVEIARYIKQEQQKKGMVQ